MFPFKTKQFSFDINLTEEQLHSRLAEKVRKWKFFSINEDGQLYGTINNSGATIELRQSFRRNSFRPVVVFKWKENNSKTHIKGYYRVALSVIIMTLSAPLFGLYLTININNIFPFLFLSIIWIIVYITFGRWLFNKDFKWMEEEFLKLVDK